MALMYSCHLVLKVVLLTKLFGFQKLVKPQGESRLFTALTTYSTIFVLMSRVFGFASLCQILCILVYPQQMGLTRDVNVWRLRIEVERIVSMGRARSRLLTSFRPEYFLSQQQVRTAMEAHFQHRKCPKKCPYTVRPLPPFPFFHHQHENIGRRKTWGNWVQVFKMRASQVLKKQLR